MTLRTRFAPSPTGYLHIGGARTALFSYLLAKKQNGKFILRIEDTDRERSTDESVQAIIDGMQWLGLDWDEGPFYQTKRFDRYQQVIEQLLTENKAYKCYCPKKRLEEIREQQQSRKEKPRYDGYCRLREADDPNAPFVVRFRNPTDGEVEFRDLVRGDVVFKNAELDDLIIQRSDGTPTYNLTVVVDDLDMNVTHVVRGDDHVNNTPRQINIIEALGGARPCYAHVPTILGEDGKRLSKRHGAVSVMQYRNDGILPQALLNCLVRLGWSHGDQEFFSLKEMTELFGFDHVQSAAAAFNPEKLLWLNQHYLKTLPAEEVAAALAWHFEQKGVALNGGPDLADVVQVQAERSKTLVEMLEKSLFWFEEFETFDAKAVKKNFNESAKLALQTVWEKLSALTAWEAEPIHDSVVKTAELLELKLGKVAQPIRVAVTGNTSSPSIDLTLKLLGKDKTLARLQRAIDFIQ